MFCTPDTDTSLPPDPSPDATVLLWRCTMVERLGYNEGCAARLVRAGVDWHELERLLAAGCSRETAARILG